MSALRAGVVTFIRVVCKIGFYVGQQYQCNIVALFFTFLTAAFGAKTCGI